MGSCSKTILFGVEQSYLAYIGVYPTLGILIWNKGFPSGNSYLSLARMQENLRAILQTIIVGLNKNTNEKISDLNSTQQSQSLLSHWIPSERVLIGCALDSARRIMNMLQ